MRKNIVVLENKEPEMMAFMHVLPPEVIKDYMFHFVVDDRKFDHMKHKIHREALKHNLAFQVYSGIEIMDEYSDILEIGRGNWYGDYIKTVKLLIPLAFHFLGKFLYLDDDAMLLRDPGNMFRNFDYCSGKESVFARILKRDEWEEFRLVFDKSIYLDKETYNRTQINSGAFIYTCKYPALYEQHLRRYFASKYIGQIIRKTGTIFDEKFLSFWFTYMGNERVGSEWIKTSQGPLPWKKLCTAVPYVWHFACKDEYTPDYIDYFLSCDRQGDALINRYRDKASFKYRSERTDVNGWKRRAKTFAKGK